MDQLLKYSKVVSIRDLQKNEHKQMEQRYKQKEAKLDLMMELERLKELKFQEDVEKIKKLKRYASAKILIEQIKEKEIKRLQDKEIIEREGRINEKTNKSYAR